MSRPILSWRTGFSLSISSELTYSFSPSDPGASGAGDGYLANANYAPGFNSSRAGPVRATRAILKFMALPNFTPRVGNDPKSVVIHLTTGTGMEIEWKDGHRSVYTFAFLRDACPCALCEEERGKSGRKAGEKPKLEPGALPMFKPAVKALSASAVGKYALRFSWNDKHDLGIYSWFYLREVCPCAECAAARK